MYYDCELQIMINDYVLSVSGLKTRQSLLIIMEGIE